ncbi:zinc-ribbon domain-containing protein [Sporolactobacillus sp. CPB3-1]|uniref:Zinc-ribbon domain-containing protein n=1 Tax=Sporolactobacillus mangiferae TaxID=2940498 RepID=A0ABT0MD08_9BACL|nr:zinc-ribbon domain-containing protein [Sporolactobacillus mangiferae]MCL1632767.1 zinc-ribbon domain-containing protein [Sporolactobacillus mangiferae]
MALHCTQCGKVLEDGAKFCTNCGHPAVQVSENEPAAALAQAEVAPVPQQSPPTRYAETSARTLTIRKRIYIPIIIIAILLAGLYYTGKVLADPQRTVESFKNAVRDHKAHQLASMIHTNENTKVTDEQAKAMLSLFEKYPETYSASLSAMESSAGHSGKQPNGSTALYRLKKHGKKFLLFDNYEISTKVVHPKAVTNLKGMKVGIKGIGKTRTADKASGDSPETVVLDAVIPGYYTLVGKSKDINTSKSFAFVSSSGKVDFTAIYLPVTANIPSAELFMNDQDTGKKLGEHTTVGPFKKNDTPSFYAVYTVNGKSIKSDTVTITKDDSDYDDGTLTLEDAQEGVELYFEEADSEDFYSLDQEDADSEANRDVLEFFFQQYLDSLGSAISNQATDEVSDYYETGSDFTKSEMKSIENLGDKEITESNQSFTIDKSTYKDSDTFSVDVTEDWNEYYYDDDNNEVDKDFTLKSNYSVKQTAPGTLKIVGHKTLSKSEN